MKYLKFLASLTLFLGLTLAPIGQAFAQYYGSYYYGRTPSLSVNLEGSDLVRVVVSNADPYASITLARRQQGSSLWTTISNFGTTDSSGYSSQTTNLASYGSNSQIEFYAEVGGRQSNIVNIFPSGNCYGYNCNNCYNSNCGGNLSFSQTNVSLSVGQSTTVTANYYSILIYPPVNSLYIASNSNSNVASAYASGSNQVVINALQSGSTTLNVCVSGGSQCGNIYVTVSGGMTGQITFSDTNPSLATGQSRQININTPYLFSGTYYVSNNTNSGVVTTSVSGSTLTLYGQSSGSTTITVCQSGGSSACGSLYVTVSGGMTGQITFSDQSPVVNVGQTRQINIYAPYLYSGSYYVSSNSNSSAVSASVSGSSLNLYGIASGSSTVMVCQSGASSNCGSLYVNVTGGGYGNVTFSNSNPSMSVGQSLTVYAYSSNNSGNNFYISSNTNSYVVSANVSGNTISLYGQQAGSSTITVCSNSASQCGYLYVTVGGSGGYGSVSFSENNVNINIGQSRSVNVYGGSGSNYYLSSNSNSYVVTPSLSGSTLNLYGVNSGSSTITVCQSGGGNCGTLYVTVGSSGNTGSLYFSSTGLSQPVLNQYYSQQLSVYGGNSPYYFYLNSGSLPQGLTLSSSGQIYGTPSVSGSYSFAVRANDNFGRSATQNFSLTITGGVLGNQLYPNGTLIQENGTVYIVYKNTKSGFVSRQVFEGFGFSFGQVQYVTNTGLSDSGYTIRTANASHPWGSWVKSGQTVYFVHELGLIPVGSYDVFLNNGGRDNLVVKANSYDFQRPMLSTMEYNDARLR
jgi:hypothetical protein